MPGPRQRGTGRSRVFHRAAVRRGGKSTERRSAVMAGHWTDKLTSMSAETVRRPAMGGTMNDIYITLNGNVAADPRQYHFDDGTRVTSLRLASTRRVFDKASQSWHDGETTFYAVRCYRVLAENVAQSIKIGQPIVVHGKLRIRSYERDGERRFLAEVEATSVGHDLRRGVSRFEKAQRGPSTPAFDNVARERLASSTRDWELVGPISEADGSGSALTGADEVDLSLSGSAEGGDSPLTRGESGGDVAEDPADTEPWADGEAVGRLAA
ncbi:single-stranded DNA-binding protein [Sphaerisporangium sp. NPDC049002]|uniref:single-stranded DNA-binding protein n=1 Tax=unclassified Sphaerisporangium TaxID=2630420 RepID=UPI0034102927